MNNISIILSPDDAMELCAIMQAMCLEAHERIAEAPLEYSRLMTITNDVREQVTAKISNDDLDRIITDLHEEKKNREI